MKWTSLILFAALSLHLNAQETLSPLTIGISKEYFKKEAKERLQKDGDEQVELPFIDDFSVDHFPGNGNYQVLWESRQATRNTGWPINPPTIGVVSFDGADEVGYPYDWDPGRGSADTLTSCPIDLQGSTSDNIGISFYYQPKGNAPFSPQGLDSLFLELYAPELDEWFWAWSTSDVLDDSVFTFVYIPITQSKYLKEGFKFRFRNYAFLQGAFSTWNLDYVWVDRNGSNSDDIINDVAFVEQEYTLLNTYTAMPRDHFAENPTQHMKATQNVLFRNLNDGPRTLEGNQFRVLHEGVEVAIFSNPNSPAIAAQSTLTYSHSVNAQPNSYSFNPALAEEELVFDVEFVHGVTDFSPTSSNDTMRFEQRFFTHYSYDDGSAEAAYSIPSSGAEVALRYNNFKSDSIFAIRIYTMPLAFNQLNSLFTIRIWEDSGNGPGALIAEQQHNLLYNLSDYQEEVVYFFEEPVFVPSGTFYVGYRQTNQNSGIKVGIDFNTNVNTDNLYYKEGQSWTLSQIEGSLLIHPMFTSSGYSDIVSVDDNSFEDGINVYPNPARDYFEIHTGSNEPYNVRIFDLGGRQVLNRNNISSGRIDIGELSPGAYILVLSNDNGGKASKKLIVTR